LGSTGAAASISASAPNRNALLTPSPQSRATRDAGPSAPTRKRADDPSDSRQPSPARVAPANEVASATSTPASRAHATSQRIKRGVSVARKK
jgi:hypothetical protein